MATTPAPVAALSAPHVLDTFGDRGSVERPNTPLEMAGLRRQSNRRKARRHSWTSSHPRPTPGARLAQYIPCVLRKLLQVKGWSWLATFPTDFIKEQTPRLTDRWTYIPYQPSVHQILLRI